MTKIIDENGCIFGKLNLIDFFALIILLLVIAGTIYKFNSRFTNINGGAKIIEYQIKIQDVKKSSAKFYTNGLKISDSKTGNYLGTINKVDVSDYFDYVPDINGVVHKAQKPDKIEILLNVKANAIETEQAYLVGGTYELKAGADIYIATKYADVIGTVEKIGD